MNNEQIKEVMRLSDDIRTAHTSEWDVSDLVEAQNDLEAYLRTIGEPENTFPLNPNGSSKWAHLQKHDGAQAIGVVFRTGSGSVGSLVDGRVVWADWLAHPNGSKPERVNAELLAIVHQTVGMIENTSIETGCCCCGDGMDGHASPLICGHSATDQGAYLAGLLYEDAKAAIARAESAIESPAKVSPCAGHAVQQDADEVIGLAQALEQHRARKIVDAVSALPVGGKHEDSPSPFHAGYQLACDEVMHRLLTEEWDGCLTPPGKQEDDEAGGA